ncbi:MAG TPA: hypothetical protein VIK38_07805 [Coriobacteriia bacterium]
MTPRWIKRAPANSIERSGDHYPGYAGSLQGLAAHVLDLPDTDPRLVELAAVYPGHYTIDEFPIGENPGMR